MSEKAKTVLKIAGALAALAAMVFFVIHQGRSLWQSGEAGAQVWFYDLKQKELFSVSNDIIPPGKGKNGKEGNGVRAVVVSFGQKSSDADGRRVAYLSTCKPELKEFLEKVKASRAAGKPYTGEMPGQDSDFFQSNTLVKRVDDVGWVALNSPEGGKITTEWRSWRGPKGQPPVVSLP